MKRYLPTNRFILSKDHRKDFIWMFVKDLKRIEIIQFFRLSRWELWCREMAFPLCWRKSDKRHFFWKGGMVWMRERKKIGMNCFECREKWTEEMPQKKGLGLEPRAGRSIETINIQRQWLFLCWILGVHHVARYISLAFSYSHPINKSRIQYSLHT